MVTALAVWSLVLIPGEPEAFIPPCDIKITNVALGDELEDETGRTTLKLTYTHPSPENDSESDEEDKDEESDDENEPITTVLCSLTPGKIEQAVIELILESDQEVLFETVGKNPIYLTGNFIDQEQAPPYDEEPDSDEEGYHLEDVSSDVEIDPDEMDIPGDEDDSHRFEEVLAEVEKVKPSKDSKKRPRESDVADADESKPSKAEKKKANKKLKADESGKAVPTAKDEIPAEAKVNGEDKKKDKKKKDKKGKDGETKQDGKGETKVLAGGLKVQDHKVGTGPQAKKGDTVGVRYVGKLDNGKVFDSNTKGKPFTFHLGRGEVIKGWDEGVAGMQVGGERLLTVPSTLGYGNKKMSDIPAGSTLTFEVKLVNIN